ncbi:MAG TPA: DUF456 domain-containing protein [Gammaproteobacteria bacterium]|nr:DUF456 domain-containing protein [Gammaproteobacteria bacterium]
MESTTVVLWIASGVLIAIGAIGLVLPILPGAPLIFIGALLAAWAEDFMYIGPGSLIVLGILTALAVAVDFVAGAFGARRFGASARAVTGATLGTIVGLFFGVVGVIVGPFVGAVIGELSVRRNLAAAGRAGIGATLGLALGTAAKLAIAFAMIGVILFMRLL